MKGLNRIKSVRWLGGYKLKLVFRDGYVGELDLHPVVEAPRGPLEAQLKDSEFFRQVTADGYSITWPNSYDICPDVLRYWCELGRVCLQQELDDAFAHPESSNLILQEKPSKK